MTRRLDPVCLLAAVLALLALALPLSSAPAGARWSDETSAVAAILLLALTSGWFARAGASRFGDGLALLGVGAIGSWAALALVHGEAGIAGQAGWGFWVFILALWAAIWRAVDAVAKVESLDQSVQRTRDLIVPVAFGLWLLFLWEIGTLGFGVPQVLLPPPSAVAERIAASSDILLADFHQTFVKSVLSGYAIGCGAGLAVAVLVDRFDFLKRGLLPMGNLVSALPIVGTAPIMVMWFGFDWQSKAAVVVLMTFFPMLVNAIAGLSASDPQHRDLMRSYGAGYWSTLVKLRLPAAMPFIFNALKINSTLALIGAIVGEFFGTPTVGMGFRISTEVGRMNIDMVWAQIAMAAVAGSSFYGLVVLAERGVTFWHPSMRQRA
jgi:NitT/TauT family transport system permease protein